MKIAKRFLIYLRDLMVKEDKTPRGEWIAVGITVAPYATLIYCLTHPVSFEAMVWITGCAIFWSTVVWCGYMGVKTAIKWRELGVTMNGKNGAKAPEGGDENGAGRDRKEDRHQGTGGHE